MIFSSDPVSAFAMYGAKPTYTLGILVFPSTLLNIGNHYSTVTGRFTCYYPGVYMFSLNLYKSPGPDIIYCRIIKNGKQSTSVQATILSEDQSGYYEGSASTIYHLNRGDRVHVGLFV